MIPKAFYATLKKHFEQEDWINKKIIATVSGGIDSMALCVILHTLQIKFVIAHCNFQLRGEDSMGDETFVKTWAETHQIPCYVQRFDTKAMLTDGGNLQELCRKLRYEWFEQLRQQLGFDYIATAHHKADAVETLLMNLLKGTGISGLHGIAKLSGKLIRPLLQQTKAELQATLEVNEMTWREDSSNKKDDYLRNKIRHHLLPLMEELNPQALDNIFQTSVHLADAEVLFQLKTAEYTKRLLEKWGSDFRISINKLKKYPANRTLLFEIIKTFGFTSAQLTDVYQLLEAHTGKYVANANYRIIKNRDFLIITANKSEESEHIIVECIDTTTSIALDHQILKLSPIGSVPNLDADSQTAYIDTKDVVWPIIIRPYRSGDYFYPLGMAMKKKKISKHLKDLKLARHEKEKIWVMESNKKIVWLVGLRLDERFKVTNNSNKIIKLTLKDLNRVD